MKPQSRHGLVLVLAAFVNVEGRIHSNDDFVNVKLSATLHDSGHHYCREI